MIQDYKDKIIQDYLEGKSISKLMLDYPFNRREITTLLKTNNISIRGGRNKKTLTQEQLKEAESLINNGAFLNELAEHFNLDKETMKNLLNDANLKVLNKNRVNRRIKSDYFSEIDTAEKAYWLGFLFTDGCVDHYKSTGRIRLQLQEKDLEILEKFKEDLQLDSKIIKDERPNSICYSVEFVDDQIFNDLSKYDIVPQKTYKITNILYKKIPEKYWGAYALGLFDGDGGLSYNLNSITDITLSYTAYHQTKVEDFQNLINYLAKIENKNSSFFTSAWHVQWRGRKQVLNILNILYKSSPRFLKRKYDKYITLYDSLN